MRILTAASEISHNVWVNNILKKLVLKKTFLKKKI